MEGWTFSEMITDQWSSFVAVQDAYIVPTHTQRCQLVAACDEEDVSISPDFFAGLKTLKARTWTGGDYMVLAPTLFCKQSVFADGAEP